MLKFRSLLSNTYHLYHCQVIFPSASLKTHSLFSTSSSPLSPPPFKMELKSIIKILEHISPLQGAESWDNVGLLLEPSVPCNIERLVITNDLTEQVLDEIISERNGESGVMVVSYHPPLFKPFKRLTQNESKDRIVVKALEAKVAVYSPHTSLDNMEGGINEWLLGGVGEGELTKHQSQLSKVKVIGGGEEVARLLNQHSNVTSSPSGMEFECSDNALADLLPKIKSISPLSYISVKSNSEILPPSNGDKLLTLSQPTRLSTLVQRIKTHLQLNHLRLAKPYNCGGDDPVIKTVAACAGSGGSVLDGVRADLLLTGEMSHHQVLAAISRGSSVVLCEHTNTERGYLQGVYRRNIEKALGGKVKVTVATTDKDPLEIV